MALLIVSASYISGNVESIAGGDSFAVILTSSKDVLIMEKYASVDILSIAPEKGDIIVSRGHIFIVSNSGLYAFNESDMGFNKVLSGNVSANKYYAVCDGKLYRMPSLKLLGEFDRVLMRDSMALGILNSTASLYVNGSLVLLINLSWYNISALKLVDFLYTKDGLAFVEDYRNIIFLLNNSGNVVVSEIKYLVPRVVKILFFNESVAYILIRSKAIGEGVSRYIIAVYSFKSKMFVKYIFSYSVYFPYAFLGLNLVNVLTGETVFTNVLSVLDYSNGRILLVLRNNTLVLMNIESGSKMYSTALRGVPYLGTIVGNRSAVLVVRVVKNYSYAYMVEFSRGSPSAGFTPKPQEKGFGIPPLSIIFAIIFYATIVIIAVLALRRR